MRCLRLLCLTALLAAGFAPAPLPRAERRACPGDLSELQGTWRVIDSSEAHLTHVYSGARVEGKRWTFVAVKGGKKCEYRLTLDRTVVPPALEWGDLWQDDFNFVGSYRLEGRTLTIIYERGRMLDMRDVRPTDFSDRDSYRMVLQWIGQN
jgi:uncharacterized protein (TIGR03067 family)